MDPRENDQHSRHAINIDHIIIEQGKRNTHTKVTLKKMLPEMKDLDLNIKSLHCVPGEIYLELSISGYTLVKLLNIEDK